jgi:hypothetical protein
MNRGIEDLEPRFSNRVEKISEENREYLKECFSEIIAKLYWSKLKYFTEGDVWVLL